jgi:uncharacterized membrane protein YeaQ/YmgE (transglycosylase-associated protein family)
MHIELCLILSIRQIKHTYHFKREAHMNAEAIIIVVLVGLVAGWLAGLIWRGAGFGLIGNVLVGIVGSFIGSFLFGILHIRFYGIIGSIVAALIGALILLFIIGKVRR